MTYLEAMALCGGNPDLKVRPVGESSICWSVRNGRIISWYWVEEDRAWKYDKYESGAPFDLAAVFGQWEVVPDAAG